MGKNHTKLIIVILVSLLLLPRHVSAQSGTCPDYTSEFGPPPAGTYRPDMRMCGNPGWYQGISIVFGSEYPCDSAVHVESLESDNWPGLYLVPPTSQSFPSGWASVRFLVTPETFWGGTTTADIFVRVVSFGAGSNQIESQTVNVRSYPVVVDTYGKNVYIVTLEMMAEANGFFTITVQDTNTWTVNDMFFSSIQIEDSIYPIPAMCEIPGGVFPSPTPTYTPPPTYTPQPSLTPSITPTGTQDPTATATNTPPATSTATATVTPWATAAGGTQTPLPSHTPYTIVTVKAEATGTEFPPLDLYPIEMSTLTAPSVPQIGTPAPLGVGLTPNATSEARATEMSGWISDTQTTYNSWLTTTTTAIDGLNPYITYTTGISSPAEIANSMVLTVSQPIAVVKALAVYMPNIWPYIFLIFLMLLWVFGNLLIKFMIAIISTIIEILRRIWEAIPLN